MKTGTIIPTYGLILTTPRLGELAEELRQAMVHEVAGRYRRDAGFPPIALSPIDGAGIWQRGHVGGFVAAVAGTPPVCQLMVWRPDPTCFCIVRVRQFSASRIHPPRNGGKARFPRTAAAAEALLVELERAHVAQGGPAK